MNVPSVDISQFIIDIQYDLSGATPQICLTPESIGAGQASVKYNYKITAPNNIVIHDNSDFSTPDAIGNGTPLCFNLPLFNGGIIWSGSDYIVIATMQDTDDLQWSQTLTDGICPPNGNSIAGSWYGKACLGIEVKCDSAEILLHDTTNYDYKGLTKTLVSKTMILTYPADPVTGDTPAPTVIAGFNDVAIPITYNGNYEARLVTIYDYSFGDNVTIRIKYTTYNKNTGVHIPVAVECNIDLCPMLCEFQDLIAETEALCGKDEVLYVQKQNLIQLLNSKILSVLLNKQCGKPVGPLIAEIQRISGFKCNCDCGNNGVVPRSLIPIGSGTYVFDCVTSCGDVAGTFTNPSGNNILLTLNDKQYVFAASSGAVIAGFTVTNATVGCVKTYTLNINLTTLAGQLMDTIDDAGALQDQFCALVGNCDAIDPWNGVDFKCVTPAFNNECDYYGNLPTGHHAMDTFFGVQVNGVVYEPSGTILYTNAAAVNAFLLTIGFGFGGTDYVVTGFQAELTTLANINSITRLYFKDSATTNIYSVNVVASNCGTVTSTDKGQGIVDTICNLKTGVEADSGKVLVDGSDSTLGYLGAKLVSTDSSVSISVVGEQVNLQTQLKVDSADNCPGYLVDKVKSNNLTITDQKLNVYAYTYVVTSTQYGAGYNVLSITINGVSYPIGIVSTNIAGIQAAINALGLGTFTVTHPGNLVFTSVGNRYVVSNVVMETIAGPVYTTFNAVQSTPVLLGECAVLFIEPLARTWTEVTYDPTLFDNASLIEYASKDSLKNVMININLIADPSPIVGTIDVNPADHLSVGLRPRTEQKILIWSGYDGTTDNAANYIIIKTTGLIQVEYNLLMTTQIFRIDSFYYPTN